MKPEIILFLIFAFFLSFRFASGTRNSVFSFFLFFLVMAEPVLNSNMFFILIPGSPFYLSFRRIIPLILFILILNKILMSEKQVSNSLGFPVIYGYEVWIYIYSLIILMSTYLNTLNGNISTNELVLINSGQFCFILIYFCTKIFIEDLVIKRFFRVILIVSILSSIFAFVQVFVDSDFFAFELPRRAFGETYRAHGIFATEYTMAFFHITVIVLLIACHKKNYPLILLNCIPVILSFHRLSYVIFIVIVSCYFISTKQKKFLYVSFVIMFFFSLGALYTCWIDGYWFHDLRNTTLYVERISQNTLSERFDQWINSFHIMADHFFGIASYSSNQYISYAASIGQTRISGVYDPELKILVNTKIVGTAIHNGFFGAGARYGILGLISFFMMCVTILIHFLKKFKKIRTELSKASLMIAFVWFLYQSSNDFSRLLTYHGIYFGILLGIFSKIKSNKTWLMPDMPAIKNPEFKQ